VEKDSHNFFCLEDFLAVLKKYHLMPAENLDKLLLLLNQFYQKAIFEDDLSIIEINFH
jgi:serine phosphatase RsbU (regulator of sigma subunit)